MAVCYVDEAQLAGLDASHVLGVVGYGAKRPAGLPAGCPFVQAPLAPAMGGVTFEVWLARAPTRPCELGAVAGACDDNFAFGAVRLAETGVLEDAVEAAYRQIFDFLDRTGLTVPLRFWNYLTDITADDQGLERYMRFNTGRHRAFLARLRQTVPPAASAVGGWHGASVIYFLAARQPAQLIENPRQVSAFAYPPLYGPTSPSFSRAAAYQDMLFISGTASIVGHETRHKGDLAGQIAETARNLSALIGAAAGVWALKIYLRNPEDRAAVEPVVDAMFGAAPRLYVSGDICRRDLLLEIEAFRRT